jgi:hypothetical protein
MKPLYADEEERHEIAQADDEVEEEVIFSTPNHNRQPSQTPQVVSPSQRQTPISPHIIHLPQGSLVRTRVRWTEEEVEELLRGVEKYGVGKWKAILREGRWKFLSLHSPSFLLIFV